MKISIYLKSGSVINFMAKSTPELIISEMSGRLLSYKMSNIVGDVQPLFIDPSEISAIVTDVSDKPEPIIW